MGNQDLFADAIDGDLMEWLEGNGFSERKAGLSKEGAEKEARKARHNGLRTHVTHREQRTIYRVWTSPLSVVTGSNG